MKKLHLVVAYEAATEWHIFMPSSIRKVLDNVPLDAIHVKSEIPVTLKEKGNHINLIDILEHYPKLSQIAFFVTLELVNLNLGNKFPYEDFLPVHYDLQGLEEAMMKGAKQPTLERYAELLLMDMRTLYSSIEKMVPTLEGKDSSTLTDAQYDYAMHSGTMLNAMQKNLPSFPSHPIRRFSQDGSSQQKEERSSSLRGIREDGTGNSRRTIDGPDEVYDGGINLF